MAFRGYGVVLTVVAAWCVPQTAFAQPRPAAPVRPAAAAPPLTVASPRKALVVTIGVGEQLTWAVTLRDQVVLQPSRIGMTLEGGQVLGSKAAISATSRI